MAEAERWWTSRIAYLETARAVSLAGSRGDGLVERVRGEWAQLDIIDVGQELVEQGAELAIEHGLRTIDAIHLASALIVPRRRRVIATWDARLWSAAKHCELSVLPAASPTDPQA